MIIHHVPSHSGTSTRSLYSQHVSLAQIAQDKRDGDLPAKRTAYFWGNRLMVYARNGKYSTSCVFLYTCALPDADMETRR